MKYVLAILLATTPLVVLGEDSDSEQTKSAINCAVIENPRERLACYDTAYGGQAMPPPKIPTDVIAPAAKIGQPSTEADRDMPGNTSDRPTDSNIDDATTPKARPGRAAPSGEGHRSRGMFALREKVEFSTTIRAIRDEGEQRMVFLFDNEQIWMQSTPRFMPFKEGDVVTIKSGLIGGFMMSNEKNVTTRVQRIK